jgi:hypothetical protein
LKKQSDREALQAALCGRPEANSDLHKWTVDGLSATAGAATISNAGDDLGGSQQARLLAGQLRVTLSRRTTKRRLIVAHFERIRDVISGPFSPEVIKQRMAAGWQLVSIEWRRELPDSEAPTQGAFSEAIPYGLRISDDCQRLEVDPVEDRTLMLMMELLVQDFPYSSIVSDLNEKGLRMRDGRPWTRVAVFNMTPRLIEVGPRLFSTEEWTKSRQRFSSSRDPEVTK